MLGRSRDRGKLHRRDTQAAVAAQHPLSADTRAVSSERGGLAGACGKWLSSKHLDAEWRAAVEREPWSIRELAGSWFICDAWA